MKYDYLIVGSGLFVATIANRLHNMGKKVLVIEKRSHIGGNIYTENVDIQSNTFNFLPWLIVRLIKFSI